MSSSDFTFSPFSFTFHFGSTASFMWFAEDSFDIGVIVMFAIGNQDACISRIALVVCSLLFLVWCPFSWASLLLHCVHIHRLGILAAWDVMIYSCLELACTFELCHTGVPSRMVGVVWRILWIPCRVSFASQIGQIS